MFNNLPRFRVVASNFRIIFGLVVVIMSLNTMSRFSVPDIGPAVVLN